MTDLEITKACAEAMGLPEVINPDSRASKPVPPCILVEQNGLRVLYDPLANDGIGDAQAMALLKKFGRALVKRKDESWSVNLNCGQAQDLNRAICECVAKLNKGTP